MRAFSFMLALLAFMSANSTPLLSRTTSPPLTTQILYIPQRNVARKHRYSSNRPDPSHSSQLWQVTSDRHSSQYVLDANSNQPLGSATLVYRMPDVTGLLGIVEMQQSDVFYIRHYG
jgi:hypothetical protein